VSEFGFCCWLGSGEFLGSGEVKVSPSGGGDGGLVLSASGVGEDGLV
jgi:hypothetical protein